MFYSFRIATDFSKKTLTLLLLLVILLLCSGCLASGIRLITSKAMEQRSAFFKSNKIKVGRGDTVYSISQKYGVPAKSLIELNKLSPPYALYVGQVLKLPQSSVHLVQKGDTLYAIARKYNVDMSSLARTNKMVPPYNIYVGQKLSLPGAIEPAAENKQTAKTKTTKAALKVPNPEARQSGRFSWPVKGKVIAKFGYAGKGMHNDGINILAPKGTKVLAAENGVVVYADNGLKAFGNLILLKHADNFMTAYAHNDSITVKKGDKIKRGDAIALVGASGGVDKSQLHFEIRMGKKPVDPLLYLE